MHLFLISISEHWPILLTIIVLVVVILFATIAFIVSEVSTSRFRRILKEETSSVRIFIIDGEKSLVTYFTIVNLREVHTQTMGEFYQKFPLSEQKRVISWINSLLDESDDTPDFIDVKISDNSVKKQYHSILQAYFVNKKKRLIHLQSFLFKAIALKKGADEYGLTTLPEYNVAISGNSKRKGVSITFSFSYRKISDASKEIDPILFKQFQNALSFLTNFSNRMIVRLSGNELLISDLRITEREKATILAEEGLEYLKRYLSINGLLEKINVYAGVVFHHDMDARDGEAICQTARSLAKEGEETNKEMILYRRGHLLGRTSEYSYSSEVERVISEKRISYLFRPVYYLKSHSVIGYFLKPVSLDPAFSSINDLKEYANGSGDDRALFATIAKTSVPIFAAERQTPSQKLFFPIRMGERGYMLQVFSRINAAKDSKIVFLLDESEIKSRFDPNNPDALINDMRSIRAKGFEVGLSLNEGELQLAAKLYGAFDYFVTSFAFTGPASSMDASVRSKLHSLVEKLLKYGKPIIASDAVDWPSIEILVRSGLEYLSSDVLAGYDAMLKALPPKAIKHLEEFE